MEKIGLNRINTTLKRINPDLQKVSHIWKKIWFKRPFHDEINTLFYVVTVSVTVLVESTVKLGNKERFDKEQIGIKELIMD